MAQFILIVQFVCHCQTDSMGMVQNDWSHQSFFFWGGENIGGNSHVFFVIGDGHQHNRRGLYRYSL